MMDLPPAIYHNEIPQACVVLVSRAYAIPPLLLGGILKVEGGRKGMAMKNSNGSYDYGPAQVNSAWLEKTKTIGVGENELRYDSCKNLWAAGWILRRCLNKHSDNFWTGVGCYHAGEYARKPAQLERQRLYAAKVYKATIKIERSFARWLGGI